MSSFLRFFLSWYMKRTLSKLATYVFDLSVLTVDFCLYLYLFAQKAGGGGGLVISYKLEKNVFCN
jgi:hypothetical protein